MSSLNKVILLGNLTRDPEYRETPNGTPVADAGIAVNRKFKDGAGQLQEEVTFVDLTFWGSQAKLARDYCHKGKQIAIEGRLKLDQWESKDGENRSKIRVVVEHIVFTGSRADNDGHPAPARESLRSNNWETAVDRKPAADAKLDEFGDPVEDDDADEIPGLGADAKPKEEVPF